MTKAPNGVTVDNIATLIQKVGIGRLITLMAAILLFAGLLLTLVEKIHSPSYTLLYGGLSAKESSQIAELLTQQGVMYEVRGESTIYVPSDKVGELRLRVAGEGLVGSSSTGYEVFDNASAFGTTSLVQNINTRRALEGELARTIMSLPSVKSARVHLVMPKKRPFMKSGVTASASVALNLGSRSLNADQVNSIAHLVAASVPNLKPELVTIVDQRGSLLSQGKGADSDSGKVSAQTKAQSDIEQHYESNIIQLLERITGTGKASVSVNAKINFNRIEENTETFNPDMQVARSEQTVEQTNAATNSNGAAAVGVTGNVPGAGVNGTSVGSSENNSTIEQTINYEIGRTVRHSVKQPGAIEQLSVAVLVEGRYKPASDGTPEYMPFSQDELSKMEALVKTAIGYDETRGDSVEIIDMAFTPVEEINMEEPMLAKADIFRLAELALLVIAMLLVLFMVIRPITKAVMKVTVPAGGANAAMQQSEIVINQGQGNVPGQAPNIPVSGAPASSVDAEAEAMIDLEQVQGRVRESSIKKVKEIVDTYPEESVNVIRGWMNGDEDLIKKRQETDELGD